MDWEKWKAALLQEVEPISWASSPTSSGLAVFWRSASAAGAWAKNLHAIFQEKSK